MTPASPVSRTSTPRLELRPPEPADRAGVFALYADPRVLARDPLLTRHTDEGQTARMIDAWSAAWQRDGMGTWVATLRDPDDDDAGVVGIGGCSIVQGSWWNLGFRLAPRHWGRGCARELAAAAVAAARLVRPDLPVTARLLETNVPSRRTVEGAGLQLRWRGPDAGNPGPGAVRLVHADRELPSSVLELLTRA